MHRELIAYEWRIDRPYMGAQPHLTSVLAGDLLPLAAVKGDVDAVRDRIRDVLVVARADSLVPLVAIRSDETRMAMMPMTTINSTRVKPLRVDRIIEFGKAGEWRNN